MTDMVENSIKLLQTNATDKPYYGAFSGGKDSVVIYHLAKLAGVDVEWHYHVVIDPPSLSGLSGESIKMLYLS